MDMAHFTVENGKRYQATINLGFVQRLASNDMVADKFREAGFTDVTVTGAGRTRLARGSWSGDNASAEIPDEVGHIDQIDV
jgi:hypothetical protein